MGSPLIAIEEHFFAAAELLPVKIQQLYSEQLKHVPGILENLLDLDTRRLSAMKTARVTLQIISHAPGLSSYPASTVTKINDYLAAQISGKLNFRGFASLPMVEPEEAASELKRCVQDLGFAGALIDNHVTSEDGAEPRYYDSAEFFSVFKAACEVDVPIYLHPTFPSGSLASHYQGSYASSAAMSFGTSGWGWHSENGLHILRMFAAGVFDKYPKLKIIIGHFGEMLPAMIGRIQRLSKRWGDRQRDFKTVWRENIWITTSGVWDIDPMATIAMSTSIKNVLFSIDWPFANEMDGRRFWDNLSLSKLYNGNERQDIAWLNAVKLFKLDAQEVLAAAKFMNQ